MSQLNLLKNEIKIINKLKKQKIQFKIDKKSLKIS
jgi:hypothetical protein